VKRSPIKRKAGMRRAAPLRKKQQPKRKAKRTGAKKRRDQCDKLFSQLIRKRDKRCLKCGTDKNLQCAHVLSRDYMATRCDPLNAITLCGRCHIWAKDAWHKDPIGIARWFEAKWPGRYDAIKEKLRTGQLKQKVDWDAVYEGLKEWEKEIHSGARETTGDLP